MNNIEWIFFDVGGVLADESESLAIRENYIWETVKQLQPETAKEEVLALWPRASKMAGKLDEDILGLVLRDKIQLPEATALMNAKKELIPTYYDLFKLRPEGIEVIPQLAKNYKLGIMANQGNRTREKLEAGGLLRYFHSADMSSDHNLRKPDPRLFKKIFEITGADPVKSVMIDDNIERGLMPAKQFGMTTVWYKLKDRPVPEGAVDYTIGSLKDLVNIF